MTCRALSICTGGANAVREQSLGNKEVGGGAYGTCGPLQSQILRSGCKKFGGTGAGGPLGKACGQLGPCLGVEGGGCGDEAGPGVRSGPWLLRPSRLGLSRLAELRQRLSLAGVDLEDAVEIRRFEEAEDLLGDDQPELPAGVLQ